LRHRLKWFIQLRAHGLSKGDEHPTNTSSGMVLFTLPLLSKEWFLYLRSVATLSRNIFRTHCICTQ